MMTIVFVLAPWFADVAAAQTTTTYKVGFWNLFGGHGIAHLPGHPTTIDVGAGCVGDPSTQVLNAWGERLIQPFLIQHVKNDPSVVAMGLAESWESPPICGRPLQVYAELGWASTANGRDAITSTATANGIVLLAKYGFAGPEVIRQLDTSLNENPADTKWVVYAPVCVDVPCSASVDVFVTHWYGTGPQAATTYDTQATQTVNIMDELAGSRPRILVGDLNVFDHALPPSPCTSSNQPAGLSRLRNAPTGAYTDVWAAKHPTDPGKTGGINKNMACVDPDGAPWKRIDYAWSRGFSPESMILIGQPAVWGDDGPSDHLGFVAGFSTGAPPPSADEIVLWASRSTVHVGDWQAVPDASAANGARMEDDDDGVPKVTTPAANPAHYYEMTFNAEAGLGYHLWLRGKAQNNYFGNDSAYVQFDGSVDQAGAPRFRIGTTSAATVVLEGCDNCGLSGWGWEDNKWNGIGGPADLIYFSTTGPQTIRIQSREDGYSIDQIVLSPAEYLNSSPGLAKNDTTILPETQGGAGGPQPVVWTSTVNATPSQNSLQKTGGCADCADAGGVSQQQISSAGGYVEFRAATTTHRLYAGLGTNTTSNTDFALIDYAFSFWPGGTWDVRERNTYRTEGTFVPTDVFRVSVESGVVRYYKNGSLVWSSIVPPAFPLVLDTTLVTAGATLSNAVISTGAGGGGGGGGGGNAPESYQAFSDRQPRTKPALPAIGSAGSVIVDPTFNTAVMRVTDGTIRPANLNRSYRTPSGTHQNAWNTDGTYFYVVSTDGAVVPFGFNAATRSAWRLPGTDDGGLMLKFHGEPMFSFVNKDLIYGAYSGPGASLRVINQYDFAADDYAPLLDLDQMGYALSGTYVGGVGSSSGPVEKLAVFFGGTQQDLHYLLVVFEKANPSSRKILNSIASTVNGQPTNIALNFKLHHAFIDRTGRYVLVYPTSTDRGAPRNAAPLYAWDLSTDVFTELPLIAAHSGGHDAIGFATLVNQDCCTSPTPWDAAQWQFRSLATPLVTKDLIAPLLTPSRDPNVVQLAEHPNWNNAQAGSLVPFVSALYRLGSGTWRPWDDEIIGIQTNVPEGTGATVWRFAHHRSNVGRDTNPALLGFWYSPRPNVSHDGRWVLFTSNWEKTLGTDPGGSVDERARQDVFLLELTPGTP
jgi:hypothetical protein